MSNKRKSGGSGKPTAKKAKYNSKVHNIEAFWSGIFVTCPRGKEAACRKEVLDVFQEYSKEFYGELEIENDDENGEGQVSDKEEESIENSIARELQELRDSTKSSRKDKTKGTVLFDAMEIGCECVIFVRVKRPINPVDFVLRICKDIKYGSQIKRSRYAQRLTPVEKTATANLDGLNRLFEEILKPVFYHQGASQTFAIRPTLRNHSVLSRDDVITKTARFISTAPVEKSAENNDSASGDESLAHNSVDLKGYDKMVLVDCYKSSLGMAVVGPEFEKEYYRFNLEQIFTNKPSLTTTKPAE